jgi:glycosyltransferase involved in cell wall biosynthesis
MKQRAISIILPVYNGSSYLRFAIESVLAQDFEDYELIIWNDASSDESPAIINSYSDPRIKVFCNQRNEGLFRTLNRGVQQAEAPLIRLWSQDDMMSPDCLGTEVNFHNEFPEVGLAYSPYEVIDETGTVTIPVEFSTHAPVIPQTMANQLMFYYGSLPGNISNVSLKTAVLKDVGPFCENMMIAGDFEMWVRILKKYPIGYINKKLISVRGHSGQLSNLRSSYVVCMKEEQTVYDTLVERLPTELRGYARWYDLLRRHPMYLHHAVKQLLSGDTDNAKRAFEQFSHSKHRLIIGAFWLLTGNQRLYRVKPRFIAS